jgi:hypothetical protein
MALLSNGHSLRLIGELIATGLRQYNMLMRIANKQTKRTNFIGFTPKRWRLDFEKGDRLGCKVGAYSIAERPNCTPA